MTHPLQHRVAHLARRVRRLHWMWALSRVLACAFAAIIVLGLADYWIRFADHGVRTLASLLVVGIIVWAYVRYVLPAWRRRSTPLEMARHVERQYPSLDDRLASSLEFLEVDSDNASAGSRALRESVIQETTKQLERVDFGELIHPRATRRAIGVAAAIAAVGIGLFAWNASASRLAVARMARPWSDLSWPQRNHLVFRNAPAQLATGADFEVELIDRDAVPLPDDVKIHWRSITESEAQPETTVAAPTIMGGGSMFAQRRHVGESFEYRATGGDDDSMPWQRLDVINPPRVAAVEITLHPPLYTGWEPYRSERRIRAYQGTRVALTGRLSKPVRSVRLHRPDAEPIAARLNAAGDEFVFAAESPSALVIDQSTPYWFELEDIEHPGLIGGMDDRWNIIAIVDQKPTIVVERPSRDRAVVADGRVPLRIVVEDDIRTHAVDLHFRAADAEDAELRTIRLLENPVPTLTSRSGQLGPSAQVGDRHVVRYEWKLADLNLEAGQELFVHATTSDFKPQTAESTVRRLRVVKPAELLEQFASRHAAILNDLARIRQLQIAAREKATKTRIQLEQFQHTDMTTADRAHSVMLSQQQVDRAFDRPIDGVLARVDAALDDVRNNHLDRDQVAEQLAEIAAQLRRLHSETLPVIGRHLSHVRKLAQATDESTSVGPIVEQLTAADLGQQNVLAVLDKILGKHAQWSGFHQLYRDVARIKAAQEKLSQESGKLGEKTVGRRVEQLSKQQQADLKKLAFSQTQLARQVETARQQLRAAANKAAAADESADVRHAISDALRLAEAANLSAAMQDAGKDLSANRIGSAAGVQQQVIQSLEELLSVLANRRERRLERLVQRLRAAERELSGIRERQEQLRKRMSDARKQTDEQQRSRELKRLVSEQQELQKQVEKFARQLRRLQAENAGQAADRASKRMGGAAAAAESGNAGGAASMARAATEDLEQAMRELAQRRRAAEMDLVAEQMASLEGVLKQLIERQQSVLADTETVNALNREEPEEVRALARRQQLLSDETSASAKSVAALEFVRSTVDRAAKQMLNAVEMLRQGVTGTDVQHAQREALRQLTNVMQAMNSGDAKPGGNGAAQGGGDGGGQAGGGRITNIAELRLVSIVQEQLIQRTAALEKQRVADQELSPAQRSDYEKLQTQQAELAEWIFKMSKPEDSDPEDRPEKFLPKDDSSKKDPVKDPESIEDLLPSLFGDE